MGTLFVAATPIGNMEDITLRALRVLASVDLVAAEDTRRTGLLLKHHNIKRPLLSVRAQNEARASQGVLARLDTGDVALVTDGGTPLVSDPGLRVVQAALAAGHRVEALPGPSALLAALSVAGLEASDFTFVGFLARRPGQARRQVETLAAQARTFVLFESPHRLLRTLQLMAEIVPHNPAVVARELTKLHEEVVRGTVAELAQRFAGRQVRGEVTVVVGRA
jgi:16S rRNA (cytidine1402-2'-O)-methyltransferase